MLFKMLKNFIYFGLTIILCSGLETSAQIPVAENSDHKTLLAHENPEIAANKKLVYDFWREVIEAGHTELATQFMAESYIQHNPNIATGRAALIERFSRNAPREINEKIKGPLVSIVAEADLVVLIWAQTHQDPLDRDKNYTTSGFDMFRIENGKLAEHWDAAPKISNPSTQATSPGDRFKNVDSSKNIAVPLHFLKNYLGLYQVTPDMQLQITLEADQLFAQWSGYSATPLQAETETQFFVKNVPVQLNFISNTNNLVAQVVVRAYGREFHYVKLVDIF